MVVYSRPEEIRWFQLEDRGLEVALLGHANPGQNHGESIGLSRAVRLANGFGATVIDHTLSHDLPLRYPKIFDQIKSGAGSNHTWLTNTLGIYTAKEKRIFKHGRKKKEKTFPARLNFGYVEECPATTGYLVDDQEQILWPHDEDRSISSVSYLMVSVPQEYAGKLLVLTADQYSLQPVGNKVVVQVPDWNAAKTIPSEELRCLTEDVIPGYKPEGCRKIMRFPNPLLAAIAPAEAYGSNEDWRFTTRGEAVLMQRPLTK